MDGANERSHRCATATIVAVLLTAWTPAFAQDYQVIDLGSWNPVAINSVSWIVGSVTQPFPQGQHAAMWKNGVLTDLNDRLPPGSDWILRSAKDINHSGRIVGSGDRIGLLRGFLWDSTDGPFVDIGDLGGGETEAWGVNDYGRVVGWSHTLAGYPHAVLYDGTLHDLGTPAGNVSAAFAISNNDTIVGNVETAPGSDRVAFYCFSGLPMTAVGTLGGDASAAYAINDQDFAVGWSEVYLWSEEAHACRWSFMSIVDLGLLPGFESTSTAFAINNEGHAVGISESAQGERRPFIWRGGGNLIDLNSLIAPQSGWVLRFATDINEHGEIVGTGTLNGQSRAFLLRPYRPEACCMPDGSCSDQDPRTCLTSGGQPQGWLSDCNSADCPQPQACCRLDGTCGMLQVDSCWQSGGIPRGIGTSCNPDPCLDPSHWQPPALAPISPPLFAGWDDLSRYGQTQIVADDWECLDSRPITEIQWWGSYIGADASPVVFPSAFQIGIWSNVPAGGGNPWSHPGTLLWVKSVPRIDLLIRFVGTDGLSATTQERCYQFEYQIPQVYWFPPSTLVPTTYWLSIAARYGYCPCDGDFNGDGLVTTLDIPGFMACSNQPPVGACARADMNCDGLVNTADQMIFGCQIASGWADPACCTGGTPVEPDHPWGWTTRQSSQGGTAVRITAPLEPVLGSAFASGQPIQGTSGSWDTAFVMLSSAAAQLQACCLPDGTCVESQAVACMTGLGGTPKGPGTTCAIVAPQIVEPPVNSNVCIGGSATFIVAATGATPLYYQWLKDGEPIPNAHEATLILNSVSATDAGEYSVRVSNACGAIVSQPVTLSVFATGGADIDRNGIVDGADVQPFVMAMVNGPPPLPQWCAADMDADGDVDSTDMSLFIVALLSA